MTEISTNDAAHFAEIAPEDQAKVASQIQRLAAGSDKAPSGKGATQATPLAQLDVVTSRFDVQRIPLSRLGQMRRDPVIAFALFFIQAQLTRARWRIESNDPQAAAFADNALRSIYSELVGIFVEKLAYGYQAAIKRFAQETPDWTYFDGNSEKPVWNNGSVKAVVWKPFAPIHPMAADPIWDNKGAFGGIKYTPGNVVTTSGTLGTADTEPTDFNVLQSLWFTNELASTQNSLWGYPRTGYSYRFWWSFWFDWGLADRHFEKDADPPIVVRYPQGEVIDGVNAQEIALRVGDRARSNSTIALPNGMVEGSDGRPSTTPVWSVDFLKGGGNFDVFKDRFEQVQNFILRAMMIPPDTFEARGGTAGYNSVSNLQDAFQLSQGVLMDDLDFVINEYMLPQLMVANGFEARVRKVTTGFDSTDTELAKLLLQGKANSNDPALAARINWDELLDATGIPRLNTSDIQQRGQEIGQQAAKTTPDPQQAAPDNVGVTDQGLYYKGRESINLSTAPRTRKLDFAQFSDPVISDVTERLNKVWLDHLQQDYSDAVFLLQMFSGKIELDESFFDKWWRRSVNRAQEAVAQTRRVLEAVMRRASTVSLDEAGIKDFAWDPQFDESAIDYISERGNDLVTSISETSRKQLRSYLIELQERGMSGDEMQAIMHSHFKMFAQGRAEKIVRYEVAQAYNRAVLYTAMDANKTSVKAKDAQLGEDRSDPECIARNNKIFTIKEAFEELKKEHPNGTLQFKIVK